MSFETFPCVSPEAESTEEPAPSLYLETPEDDPARLLIKKPVNTEPSRLAETANIEDQMMSEDEIAQVNAKSGDALKLNTHKDYQESEADQISKKNADDQGRRTMEENNIYEVSRPHWIQLNYGNTTSVAAHTETPNDRQQEADRASVIIKRTNNKEQQEVESDSDTDSQDTSKIRANELRCNEKISGVEANDENVNALQTHSSRTLYYNYNAHHEDVNKLEDKGNIKLQTARGELLRNVHGETKALPVYYMPAGAYPHMVATAGGNALSSTNVLQREHFVHAGTNELKRFPVQHMDYVSGRPEQQVPVASSAVNPNEGSVFGNLQHRAPGLQYMDRRLVHAGGYAVVPGIGPVRVIDGVYYQGLPMGSDQSRYENNFASAPSFLPSMSNMPADVSTSQPQLPSSSASNKDLANQRGQDKLLNAAKPYASPVHPAVSPASSLEERRSTNSPAVKSDSSSPAPGEDPEGKKLAQNKLKGKPKPTTGTSKPEIKCEQCGKTFGSSSALAKHKLTHSDERRYVCSTCGKGFKRQDHLNGHMVTHRDKKPYECSFTDCDKSYCDMRSLRRHLENHHTANGNSVCDSRTPGSGSPSLNCNDKRSAAGNTAVSNERVGSPRNLPKITKVRSLKDKNDHLQVSGYDSGRSSGRSTPGSTHEPGAPRERPNDLPLEGAASNAVRERERNSDSFSSTTSEDGVGNTSEQSVPEKATDAPTPHSAVDLLKQAADRVKVQQTTRNANDMWQERFQQPYMVYQPDGTPYQQWYPTAVYAQDPRFVYQYPMFPSAVYQVPVNPQAVSGLVNDSRQRMMNDADTPTEMTKTVGVSTQATSSPSLEYQPTEAMQIAYYRQQQGGRHAGTPTDPTAVAVATAKEMGQYRYTGDSFYGVHPSGTQWQPVHYDEKTNAYQPAASMGNSKSLYGHAMTAESNGSNASDNDLNHVETLARGTEFRNSKNDDGQPAEKRQRLADGSTGERRDNNGPLHAHIKLEDNNNAQDKGEKAVFRNPAEIVTPPRRKQRPRPEPLTIPPSVSTTYFPNRPGSPVNRSQPCSPPYTPPPMLSPRSIYHVPSLGSLTPRLSASLQLPMTPSRLLLSGHRSSFDGDEVSQFPEPKINVGPQFQAEVPPFAGPKEGAIHDVHKATLCWKPIDEKKRMRREEIESFLDMACSVAVVGGGSNKEYALHILHRANGNVKEAVKLLLCQKYITQRDDPMYDYHYEGSVRWSSKERQIFRQNFRTKGKEFADLQKDIGGKKTIFDCIEFYYHWKAAHPEAVRGRTRYIDSNSEDYEDTESETNSNPSYFECDFPHCNAKFVSRQALNGHIRVHGGSFMKPSEPSRRKIRNTTGPSATNGTNATHAPRKRKSPSPAPASVLPDVNNPDGPLPEFACKVCGRIFHKIKSRSAHMKTHVKRPDDDEKVAAKLAASKNH